MLTRQCLRRYPARETSIKSPLDAEHRSVSPTESLPGSSGRLDRTAHVSRPFVKAKAAMNGPAWTRHGLGMDLPRHAAMESWHCCLMAGVDSRTGIQWPVGHHGTAAMRAARLMASLMGTMAPRGTSARKRGRMGKKEGEK